MNQELINQLRQELKNSGINLADIHSYASSVGLGSQAGTEPEPTKPAAVAPAAEPSDFEKRKQQIVQRMGTQLSRSLASAHKDALLATLTKQTDPEQFDQAVDNLNRILEMAQKAKTVGGPAATSFVSAINHYVTQAKQQPAAEPAAKPTAPAADTASAAAPAQPMARPYRFRVGDKISSYQIVNNKWKIVDVDSSGRLAVVGDVPIYMVSSLNALKKKVDAQRATGNLTDSRRQRGMKV